LTPYSKLTELKLLLTTLQNQQPKLRALVLGEASREYFGNQYAREIRERMETLLQRGKTLGSSVEEWYDEPGLSQDAKDFLKGADKKLVKASQGYSKDRITKLIHNLKLRYRLRVALKGMEDGAAMLEGRAGERQLDAWHEHIQRVLEQFKQGDERSERLTIGKGQSNAAIQQLVKRYTKTRKGQIVSLGMRALDFYYGGAQRGNVVTLSANSGGGKSVVALNMAINQVSAGFNVCYYSMEMDNDENMHRLIANRAEMDHSVVQVQEAGFSKKQKHKISRAIYKLHRVAKAKKSRLTLVDVKDSSFTPQQLEVEVKPYHYDIIYIDYITLFGSSKHTETWKMHLEYSRFLKGMAKRLNCVVVILAQLSDDEQLRYGKAIRDNTDFWFYWTYGEDEMADMETELKTGKARNHQRRHCMLDMRRLNNMIVTTISDDLPDPSVVSARDQRLEDAQKPARRNTLLKRDKKKPKPDGEVSKKLGFDGERRKGNGARKRRPKRDIDGP
jgi:replicative DNA helicase